MSFRAFVRRAFSPLNRALKGLPTKRACYLCDFSVSGRDEVILVQVMTAHMKSEHGPGWCE